jgi:hypothetical protein
MRSPGKQDSLIWPGSKGGDSPLGPSCQSPQAGQGYHGYRFRIMTAQGADAPGGVADCRIQQRRNLNERDLGPSTAVAAPAMRSFNPGPGWQRAAP